jgi:patatin-like phospholipase/acyl hydrolase
VAELFDLVAGASTGGVIALSLTVPDVAAPRWSAAQVVEMYRTEAPRVFRRPFTRLLTSLGGLLDERYSNRELEGMLTRYLGPARLSNALTDVLIPAYDLQLREPFVFSSRAARTDPALDAPCTRVALAACAAPTYFEPVEVLDRPLIDGALFAANPAAAAYAEARRLRRDAEPVVLSLGTGSLRKPIDPSEARGWGEISWARPMFDIVLDGQSATVAGELDALLGPRHHRLQIDLPPAADAPDDASPANIAALTERAQALIAERSDELDALAAELRRD